MPPRQAFRAVVPWLIALAAVAAAPCSAVACDAASDRALPAVETPVR